MKEEGNGDSNQIKSNNEGYVYRHGEKRREGLAAQKQKQEQAPYRTHLWCIAVRKQIETPATSQNKIKSHT